MTARKKPPVATGGTGPSWSGKDDVAVLDVHHDGGFWRVFAGEDGAGQRIFDLVLDRPLQRPGTVYRIETANFLNTHYAGMTMEQVRERLKTEVERLRGEVAALMQAAVNVGSEALSQAQDDVVISGERNLLAVSEFSSDMHNLRRAFDLFEQKTQILRLLDVSSQAEGVRIFIGGESQVMPFEDLSVVSAPYEVDGQVVGTLGVIGPTRMAYDRMIEIVDITSRLVSNALSHRR